MRVNVPCGELKMGRDQGRVPQARPQRRMQRYARKADSRLTLRAEPLRGPVVINWKPQLD